MSHLGANREPGGVHSQPTRSDGESGSTSGSGYDATVSPSSSAGSNSGAGSQTGFDMNPAGMHDSGATIAESIADLGSFIAQSGLMSPQEFDEFQQNRSTDGNQHTAQTMADALIADNRLTSYQASVLMKGQTRGLVLGNYVVLEKLGEGGMGMVFKARHRRMKRIVALKVLPPALTGSPAVIQRFHREVEAAAKLTHPNIAQAFDADEADGIHFLVMEHVDGPNLSAYIKEFGPIPPAAAVSLMVQAARGLAHAHEQGVVHRDIKPGNLMVNGKGVLKILDMGLAQLKVEDEVAEQQPELTQSGRVMGTVDYMAPEQALDAKRVDLRADIYSLGCSLFYLLSGRALSPEGSMTQKLLWHQNELVPPLAETCPAAPEKLNEIFQQMVGKKPEDRQETMAQVVAQLEDCLAELPADERELVDAGIAIGDGAPSTDHSLRMRKATFVERGTRTQISESPFAHGGEEAKKKGKGLWVALALLLLGGAVGVTLWATGILGSSGADVAKGDPTQPDSPDAPNIPIDPAGGGGSGAPPSPGDASGGGSVSLPATPLRAHEALLTWVFESGGTVTVMGAEGRDAVEASSLSGLPQGDVDIRGIKLDRTAVQDADLVQLTQLPMLERLSLANTQVTDAGLAEVAELQNLVALDLSGTAVSNDGLTQLARMAKLRELNLQKTSVSDQGMARLGNLRSLEKLYLADTQVGDPGVAQLERIATLDYLTLNGTNVTQAGIDGLAAANSDLEPFWDGEDIDRNVAHRLLDLGARLKLLTRDGNVMEDISRRQDLPQQRFTITTVDLSGNPQVGDEDLQQLASLVDIESLSLGGTGVTSNGLFHLHGLQSLRRLDLGRLQLSPVSTEELASRLAEQECEIITQPSSDREVALWVFAQGGKATIVTREGQDLADLSQSEDLPLGPFALREIHLDGLDTLTDEQLAQFADLPGLETLFIAGSGITDTGLSHLSGCTRLRELSLSDTVITSAGLAELAHHTNLQKVYLAGTSIDGEGLRQLIVLPELTHLSLAGTDLNDADLTHLKGIEKLTWLDLTNVPLTDDAISHLTRLPHLAELRLEGTQISDAGIEDLADQLSPCHIEHEPLSGERLAARWVLEQGGGVTLESGEISRLSDLPRDACIVTSINLDQVERLPASEIAQQIARCPNLRELRLTKTSITDSTLAALDGLSELERLVVAQTNISDAGLAHAANCPKLKLLDARATRVTGSCLSQLSGLTSLQHLLLGQCRLSDRSVAGVAAFATLESLDLSASSQITDAALEPLSGLENLKLLWLRGTRITDAATEQIATHTGLTNLDLSSTEISDAGLAPLAGLENLTVLNLSSTEITDSGLSTLGEMKQLTRLSIVTEGLSEAALNQLEAALPECRISKPATTRREEPDASGGGFRPGFSG